MIGKPTLTDKIINFIADLDDAMDYPKSFGQLLSWDRHEYYKQKNRIKAAQRRERKRIKDALWRLEKAEAITFNKKLGEYKLTPKGWLKFMHFYNQKTKKKEGKTEGKYLMFFDIPEEYSRFRDLYRTCLKNLGCRMIQKSVWTTNDLKVLKFVQKIAVNCELEGHVRFTEIKKIL